MQPTPRVTTERRGVVTSDALVDLKCPPWFMDKPTGLRFSSSSVLQFNRPVQWQRPLSTPLRGFMVSVRWYSSPATSWVCFIWNERHASCCPTCQTGEFQPVRLWTVCAHTAQHFLNIRFHSASCWLRPCGVWNQCGLRPVAGILPAVRWSARVGRWALRLLSPVTDSVLSDQVSSSAPAPGLSWGPNPNPGHRWHHVLPCPCLASFPRREVTATHFLPSHSFHAGATARWNFHFWFLPRCGFPPSL